MEDSSKFVGSGGRMLRMMLAAGTAIGIAFPFFTLIFVQPRSTLAWWAFFSISVAAGVSMGLLCNAVSSSVAEKTLQQVLGTAGRSLGVAVHESKGLDALAIELHRVFGNAAVLLDQIRGQ